MPRPLRIEFPGAFYHVLCRGDRKEPIVQTDADRELFLRTLGEACEKTGWRVHAYVLMPNHYHLLLETPEPNLVAGMHWFQGTYTARYNRRHRLAGHLFQGRYKALLVDSKAGPYLQTVSSYIHLNPVRARMISVDRLAEYPWSSLGGYLKVRERPAWLEVDRVLGAFGFSDTPAGRRHYLRYLMDRASRENREEEIQKAYAAIRRGWCYGGKEFREWVLRDRVKMGASARRSYSGAAIEAHDEQAAERILEDELKRQGLTWEQVRAMSWRDKRKRRLARRVRTQTLVTNAWVAERLGGGHESTVSRAVHEQE